MATEIVKSTAITNADATPVVKNTTGEDAVGIEKVITSSVAITSGVTAAGASYYRGARLPWNAKVKKVEVWLDAASTTITGDVGIYYSDDVRDGTSAANVATAVVHSAHFVAAKALAAIVTPTEVTVGVLVGADLNKELWNTTGSTLTSRPAGMADIVFTLTSTAGAAAQLNFRVTYCE